MSKEVVVFGAKWCSHCGPFKQALTDAGVKFREVDADSEKGKAEARKYNVRGLPTTIILRDGYKDRHIVGTGNIEAILKELEE